MSKAICTKDIEQAPDCNGTDPVGATVYKPHQDAGHPNPLIGIVITYSKVETEYGTAPTCWVREDATGTVWSQLIGGTALINGYKRERPKLGERVRVEYLGQKVSERGKFAGKEYANWSVQVQRPAAMLDFDLLDPDNRGEQAVGLIPAENETNAIDAEVPIDAVEMPELGDGSDHPFDD